MDRLVAIVLGLAASGNPLGTRLVVSGTIRPTIAMSAHRDGPFVIVEATRAHMDGAGHWRQAYYAPDATDIAVALTDDGLVTNLDRGVAYAQTFGGLSR